jgi:hypothetical protein
MQKARAARPLGLLGRRAICRAVQLPAGAEAGVSYCSVTVCRKYVLFLLAPPV